MLLGAGCCISAGRFEALQVATAAEKLPGKNAALAARLGVVVACAALRAGAGWRETRTEDHLGEKNPNERKIGLRTVRGGVGKEKCVSFGKCDCFFAPDAGWCR